MSDTYSINNTSDTYSDEDAYKTTPSGVMTKQAYIDGDNVFAGNVYTDNLVVGDAKITTALIEDLEVGNNVTMGANATMSWSQIEGEDKPNLTYIDSTGIYTGTVNAENLVGTNIKGLNFMSANLSTPFQVYIGNDAHLSMEVYNGSMKLYDTLAEYFNVSLSSFTWAGHQVATQDWVASQGYSTGSSGDVYWWNTYSIQRGGASMKFLFGSATIQARNYSDTAYGTWEGLAYSNVSRRELKKDIEDYTNDALSDVMDTKVYTYRYLTDLDTEPLRVGLIFDEAPLEIMQFSGGIDIYGMASMLWKALQQLTERVKALEPTV